MPTDDERRRLDEEKKNDFLFGIHIVAFVMIYAVTHAPEWEARR
jgi:hypothetical protein